MRHPSTWGSGETGERRKLIKLKPLFGNLLRELAPSRQFFAACRVDREDPFSEWHAHNAKLKERWSWLNGNRFAYSGTNSVIDVSAIPVAAVERIEIVTDGASAIYGADAVAGVVNILLRKDYEGFTTTARDPGCK